MPNTIKTIAVTDDATRQAAMQEIDRLHAAPRHSPDAALGRELKKAVTHYDERKEQTQG